MSKTLTIHKSSQTGASTTAAQLADAPVPTVDTPVADAPVEAVVEAEPARRAYVRAVYGDMVHMHTSKPITKVPTKMDIDPWLQAQIDAGKVAEGEDD